MQNHLYQLCFGIYVCKKTKMLLMFLAGSWKLKKYLCLCFNWLIDAFNLIFFPDNMYMYRNVLQPIPKSEVYKMPVNQLVKGNGLFSEENKFIEDLHK